MKPKKENKKGGAIVSLIVGIILGQSFFSWD